MAPDIRIGAEDQLTADERLVYPRYLGFRPADGQVCELNPPRFSWPYDPETIPRDPLPAGRQFQLRIGHRPGLQDPLVTVESTPYNFYNALPVLRGSRTWYWQVTYDPGTANEHQSRVRSFELAPDAVPWDRTVIAELDARLRGHPRMIFTPENREALRALREQDPECRAIARQAIALADETLEADWFRNFPETDADETLCIFAYAEYAQWLQNMVFAFLLTDDRKYLIARERLLCLAAYEPGGYASPEGSGHGHKFSTKITEHLGISFDWLYDELSSADREVMIRSLDWRIDHIMSSYSWLHDGEVRHNGLAVGAASHPWEDFTWTLSGALAVAEHSPAARQFAELGLHYLTGVANSFGPDEGWNEGVSYGNWKFSSLVATSLYTAMTLPALQLERNPFYRRMGDFFLYLTPVGCIRPGWGDMAYQYRYHERGQHAYRRKLAYFTGDRSLLDAWHEWRAGLRTGEIVPLPLGEPDINEITDYPRPWIEYALKHFFAEPKAEQPKSCAAVFPIAGWAMGYSEPPGTLASFREGVGFVFNCRPQGGYSHSHQCNGGFELHAYGETVATCGGSKSNWDFVARSSLSQNVVLIDGRGQCESPGSTERPNAGRLLAWKEAPDLVYGAADVRNAYVEHPQLARFVRHFLFLRGRYFVIFDDLALSPDTPPGVFSWLYHVQHDVPVDFVENGFHYAVGDTRVKVMHLGETGPLRIENMSGDDWYRNPVTGENRSQEARDKVNQHPGLAEIWKGLPRVHNNLWVTTERCAEAEFLVAVLPYRAGEPEPQAQKLAPRVIEVSDCERTDIITFGEEREDAFVVVDC